jgi:hypothetical protein
MSDWTKLTEFATRFEAELAYAQLQNAEIPAYIRSHEGGLFGPGFQGSIPSGVDLLVATEYLSAAREHLADLLEPRPNGEL